MAEYVARCCWCEWTDSSSDRERILAACHDHITKAHP